MTPSLDPVIKQALLDFVAKSRVEFMARFGHWVKDASKLEDVFLRYGSAQVSLFCETDAAKLQDWEEVKHTVLLEIETTGLEFEIIGKVDAKQFLRDEIVMVLGYVPIVAGILVKVALPLAFPGVGSVIGPPLGAGVEYFLGKLMGVKP